jgi:hypothetical protein
VSERVVDRRRRGQHPANAIAKDSVELIRKLAAEFDDAQIARILSKQGCRMGNGNPLTSHKVAVHGNRNGIPNCPQRVPTDARHGPFPADEAAAQFGVTSSTIHRWLANGILPGKQIALGAPWRIVPTDDLRARLTRSAAPQGWLGLTDAARELGLSKSQVAYLVKTGKSPRDASSRRQPPVLEN